MEVSKSLLRRARITTEWNEFSKQQTSRIKKNLEIRGLPLPQQISRTGIVFGCFTAVAVAALPMAYSRARFVRGVEQELDAKTEDVKVLSENSTFGRLISEKILTLPSGEQATIAELAGHIVASHELVAVE